MINGFRNSYKRLSLLVICTISVVMLSALRSQAYNDVFIDNQSTYEVPKEKTVQTITYVEKIIPECQYIEDDSMYIGEEIVAEEEVPGLRETTVLITYNNGEEEKREILDQEVVEKPVPRKILVGTKVKPRYILPVSDYVFTSGFGPRWGKIHCGVDLAVPTGTEVAAAADGTVIQSGWNGGYGISVYIEHDDGSITRYGHMSETYMTVGDKVSQGDIIGLSGSTGDSTGPHVHFEIRIDGEAVNPVDFFDEGI